MKFKTLTKTCGACPTQWEGETVNGNQMYFRYRHGCCYVELNGTTIFSSTAYDGDGVMYDEDVMELLEWLEEPEKGGQNKDKKWFEI